MVSYWPSTIFMQMFKQLPWFLDPAQSVVTPCYYAWMYMWLCTFMLCYQLLLCMLFMQLDRSYLWFLDPAQSAMQTACGYACMFMWLCTFMLCGQLSIMHAISATVQVSSVILRASSASYADRLLICTRVHVSMHICCMRSAIDHPRYSCSCLSNFRDS